MSICFDHNYIGIFLINIISDISSGLSTSHFAWAFHSVAEEELLNMLPAMQKDDPTWSELRAMGVGWWVRNTRILRKCIEKVSVLFWCKNEIICIACLLK